MPTKEDYKGMHEDAVTLMDLVEQMSGVAKRMSSFSGALIGKENEEDPEEDDAKAEDNDENSSEESTEDESPSSSSKNKLKKLLIIKLRKSREK